MRALDDEAIVPDRAQYPFPEASSAERVEAISQKELLLISAATLAALALRVFMLRFAAELTGDGVWYAILGKSLIHGDFRGGLSTYWSPLYPLLIGGTSLVVGDLELAGRLASVLAGGLLVIPVYLLARRVYGKREAGIAALLTVVWSPLVLWSTQVLTESVYTLLFTFAMLAGLAALSQWKRWLFFLTGAGFGACYLVKPEAIGFCLLIVAVILSQMVFKRRSSVRHVLLCAVLAAVGFAAVSLPYVLYLHNETGRWTVSEKLAGSLGTPGARSKWRGLINGGDTTLADKLWSAGSSRASTEAAEAGGSASGTGSRLTLPRPIFVARLLYYECKKLVEALNPLFLFLTGLALVGTSWSPERPGKEAYLLLFVVCMLLGYAVTGFEDRYLASILPIFIVWSSRGLLGLESAVCRIEEEIRQTGGFLRGHRSALRVVLLVCVIASLAPSLLGGSRSKDGNERQIASWINNDSAPTTPLIMAGGPLMAFLTGGKHLYTPDEEYNVVVDYARRKGIDYLVVEERLIGVNPRLNFLLDDDRAHPGLELVQQGDTPNRKVRVFKLTGSLASTETER